MSDEFYTLWLAQTPLSYKKQSLLLSRFGSSREIFFARSEALNAVLQQERDTESLLLNRKRFDLGKIEETLLVKKISYITKENPKYPRLLREIDEPPLGLYVRGELPVDVPCVSIIGSRRCSEYGLSVAKNFASGLAANGVLVVSGMAKGADSVAHRGALMQGSTVAVLGCGMDVCYPAENRGLMEEISQRGAVVTEYPLGTEPNKINFPRRNRIISGFSMVLVVVEATEQSGTLITVGMALEQGRTVMAVPGNIFSKLSFGTNFLIKQGAEIATCVEDILFELKGRGVLNFSGRLNGQPPSNPSEEDKKSCLTEEERPIYDSVGYSNTTLESISENLKMDMTTVNYLVTLIELKGLIKRNADNTILRII